MKFLYGIPNHYVDVTNTVLEQMIETDDPNLKIIHIFGGDHHRMAIFKLSTDPILGVLKHIRVVDDLENIAIFHAHENVYLKYQNHSGLDLSQTETFNIWQHDDPAKRLNQIHCDLKLNFGSFSEEFPEQLMSARFLTGDRKVLEIGGNIGRNSLVIGHICEQLVTLETDVQIAQQLISNRDLNGQSFHVENSALSYRPLYQNGWQTYTEPAKDRVPIKVVTLEEIQNKYQIMFDTLVLDCEGAFYYILQDCPQILNGITLIIMENDYLDIEHKRTIDLILAKHGFCRVYIEAGGWGPCKDFFYETWAKYK